MKMWQCNMSLRADQRIKWSENKPGIQNILSRYKSWWEYMCIVITAQLLIAAGSRISTIRCLTIVQSFPSCGWELILATSHSHGSLLRCVGKRGPVWVPRCRASERANTWIYWEHMGSGASWLRADAQHWLSRTQNQNTGLWLPPSELQPLLLSVSCLAVLSQNAANVLSLCWKTLGDDCRQILLWCVGGIWTLEVVRKCKAN